MKYLSLVFVLIFNSFSMAALPSNAVFELRATASANNVNGGGFNRDRGGTDYTQQDAAQLTNTDLATSGAGATTITSAGGGFTSAMVGNYVHITAGTNFQAGWYEITTFTDANNVIVDRTPSSGGAGSGGTFYVGGAMSLNSTLDDDFFEIVVASNTIWIKNGTFTLGESVNMSGTTYGTSTMTVRISGYNSTQGDAPTGSSRPTIAVGSLSFVPGQYHVLSNLIFTGTGASMLQLPASSKSFNCKSTNNSTSANRAAMNGTGVTIYDNCEAISYRGYAMENTGGGDYTVRYCYFHDSVIGLKMGSVGTHLVHHNIIESNTTAAIQETGAFVGPNTYMYNTLYGSSNTTGVGIDFTTGGQASASAMNNIIVGFSTGVWHRDINTTNYDNYNAYYNNDLNVPSTYYWQIGPQSVLLDPQFVNVKQSSGTTATTSGSVLTQSGADFSNVTDNVDFVYLVSGTGITAGQYKITAHTSDTITLDIAPGTDATADKVWQITTGDNFAIGTNLKARGFPGAFQAGYSTGYMDIGAVQRQEAGGGSFTFIGN